jgi:predicted dehydrogenase
VLAIAGAPVRSVSASGVAVKGAHADEAEAWLTFANGAVATLSASRVAEKQERRSDEPAEMMGFAPHDNLAAEIAAFLNSVQTGATPEADGRAGLAAVEVAERIRASIADADLPLRRSL